MTVDIASLVSNNLDIWTTAVDRKSGSGRGGGKRISLYGIDRLRSLIVDLAVRGKLTSQQPDEEPAAVALAKFAKARRRKIELGQARKPKALLPFPANLPNLPEGWVWTQLGTIAEISPSNSADDQVDASFVPMALISTRIDGVHETKTRKWSEIKKGFTHFSEGDIGLAKITPCFENGKAAIFENLTNGIGAGTTELHVARPWSDDVNPRYLLLTMKTTSYLHQGAAEMTGTAGQKRVTRSYFESSPLPLPPLAEQQRIVAKVDELMALCDALEMESAAAMAAHQMLVEALLATLTTSADTADLATNWARLETHFDSLFITEASVDALKQTVIDLAMRGRLSSDVEFDWTPKPLGAFVKAVSAGWSPKCIETPRMGNDWGVLKVSAVTWGQFRPAENKQLPPSLRPRPEIEVRPGDFLISRANTADLVARSVVVPKGAPTKLMMSDKIIRFRFSEKIDAQYVSLFHASTTARTYYARVAGGTSSSMKNVSQGQIRALQIPVPPLPEQRSIVAKVDAMMVLCDALKARIAEAAQTQCHLADTIIQQAVV